MELDIAKNTFLEIEKISTLKGHIDKIKSKEINNDKVTGVLEIDISYRDLSNNECFKSMSFDYNLELDGLNIKDLKLKGTNVYVVEGRGISVDYVLSVEYDSLEEEEIEIIKLEDDNICICEDEIEEIKEEVVEEEAEINHEEEINKIKEDISKDYENKLADNLNHRENKISIVSSKNKSSELEFLRFFDDTNSSYFKIKTLLCESEKELDAISKEYRIPISELLIGYDKQNGKVTFKYSK